MKKSGRILKNPLLLGTMILILGSIIGFVIAQTVSVQTPVNQNQPWHVVQQVSDGSAQQNSIDSNSNGMVDRSDTSKGCVLVDTGKIVNTNPLAGQGLGDVTWTNATIITMLLHGTNICEDDNGCDISIIAYFAPTVVLPSTVIANNPISISQLHFLQTTRGFVQGAGAVASWISTKPNTGTNGPVTGSNKIIDSLGTTWSLVTDSGWYGVFDWTPDAFIFLDNTTSAAYYITVCD